MPPLALMKVSSSSGVVGSVRFPGHGHARSVRSFLGQLHRRQHGFGPGGSHGMAGDFLIFIAELLGVDDAIGFLDFQIFGSSVHLDVSVDRHEIEACFRRA